MKSKRKPLSYRRKHPAPISPRIASRPRGNVFQALEHLEKEYILLTKRAKKFQGLSKTAKVMGPAYDKQIIKLMANSIELVKLIEYVKKYQEDKQVK